MRLLGGPSGCARLAVCLAWVGQFQMLGVGFMAREFVWLECTETGLRNYRVNKETRGTERLELKKYNNKLRKHTAHKESRKK